MRDQEARQRSGRKFWWAHFVEPVDKNEFITNNQGPSMGQLKGAFPDTWKSWSFRPSCKESSRKRPALRREEEGDKRQFGPRNQLTSSFPSSSDSSHSCYQMNWRGRGEAGLAPGRSPEGPQLRGHSLRRQQEALPCL